ncbi:putative oxidoreductase C terminal-domain-containing protein [Xylogone sp. PMI_703]|nr:putative oxidoreductase C terminal-domain-containing protein [Xylogone sp. PMI_703]
MVPASVPESSIPVLFIGAGNITFGNDNVAWNHSLRIERYLGTRLKVIGIVDPSAERTKQVLEQKSTSVAASCYADARHFLNLKDAEVELQTRQIVPELIILAAPPHYRGTQQTGRDLELQVLAAFGPTPALFIEKPVSTARPEDCGDIFNFLEKSGNTTSLGYMLRYLKVVQKAVSIIQENHLQVMAINARYTCAYSKVRKADWWDKSKQCGPIVEQATHFADLCRYLGGEVDLETVTAAALEHYEPAGKLSHMAVDESRIPESERIPRVTAAFWKFKNGGLGTLMHIIALHGIKYSNEIVVAADGYQMRLVDLYTTPTLFVRTPASETEEVFNYPYDDPFYSEFASLLNNIGIPSIPQVETGNAVQNDITEDYLTINSIGPSPILSSYSDAFKTYEFTWRIRDESERSSKRFQN